MDVAHEHVGARVEGRDREVPLLRPGEGLEREQLLGAGLRGGVGGVDRDVVGNARVPVVEGERGLGAILVHHLGASQRWRHGFQQTGESPEPELEPLPTIDQLRERWDAEWADVDVWLPTLTDDFVAYVHEGVPVWQMLVHVVNHGTQHRAEAAALLTLGGRSPGDLDLINYAEERAHGG